MNRKIDRQTHSLGRSLKFMTYNPLSFSQNIHHELSLLVRDALTELGVPDRLLHDFDSHSTIAIDMNEERSINISLVDDRLFIWSFIPISEELLIDNSKSIIPVITTAMEHIETGHLTLGKCNDGFELKALVNPLALVENKLSQVIYNFHSALKIISNHR
ncbi:MULTISPECIES: SPI-1 type III secretion system chaperone SpaK [unclassified Pseudomonas]|uniref:InvB/SpaK family type III secretion system chaperone n=1 Tax=unclassified Pseudomonas TaxID=196821 RepID=UPI0011EE5539|nr:MULTISPECIES: SPI-1 type III secretion system chaperone SpaK [unclassified Pseudomonas]KAA0944740.1 SPI-1 type III secretion system chaperone SpaK [Pseudomonas sp. ANT_H4]KAA0948926.1 SPI-1 type III secretion system chaperone SpaK [Pseudomonas sp. ANT_H14]